MRECTFKEIKHSSENSGVALQHTPAGQLESCTGITISDPKNTSDRTGNQSNYEMM